MYQHRNQTRAAFIASLLRPKLAAHFPGVKFKVRSATFSQGNSVDIYWNGKPSVNKVRALIGQHGYYENATADRECSVKFLVLHRRKSDGSMDNSTGDDES